MGDIVIEEANNRAFALSLASFFMLVASISILVFGTVRGNNRYIIVGLLAAIVFLVCFLASIMQAVKEKVLLTITLDGFIDSPTVGGLGFISYDDISNFEIVSQYNAETIAVILKDRDRFIAKLPPVKRRKIKSNLYLKQPLIIIHTELAKDMETMDIFTLLQKRLKDYQRLYE